MDEQRRSGEALRDADRLIVGLERLIGKKESIKNGMAQELLTERTRLPGFSGSWSEVTMLDCAEIVSGGTPKSSVQSYWDGDIRGVPQPISPAPLADICEAQSGRSPMPV